MNINYIISELYNEYYDYYCTVFIDFIKDAVINTLKDLYYINNLTIEKIHEHIKENYI